ncbi:hypothetical protein AAG570_012497 [Ranatra chinensis]|uniref:Major facilitator superfamily (MFS) profile domain-containing protein n=1 Tax=Ranatra chinensis TaxID=642074 RepID=A0ABD0YQJ4_9HEMI
MLALFSLASMCNATHWIQYSIIAHIVAKYYNVSLLLINWTSMIFMAVYIPLVFPATWLIERWGLRFAMITGTVMLCVGAWLKLVTLEPSMFYVALGCQLIIGSAQMFTLSVPSRLAALWFGHNEVSTACAIGVFGNQVGIALSFLIPPEVVHDSNDMEKIKSQLMHLYIALAAAPTILLIFIIIFFEAKPAKPPSVSQANINEKDLKKGYLESMKELLFNKDYMLLTLSYGANVGVFYAYSTLLNQLILIKFEDGQEDAGQIGLSLIVGGMFGAIFWGYILDKTHKYKATTLGVYSVALIGMLGFTFSLHYHSLHLVYISSAFLGVFMNGYLPIAYEFAAELTYPIAESTSSGVLNAVGELVGVTLVQCAGMLLDNFSDLPTNIMLSIILGLGFVLCLPISGNRLLRLAACEN